MPKFKPIILILFDIFILIIYHYVLNVNILILLYSLKKLAY